MELSKGAAGGLIAVVVVLVLGLGWFFFLRPPGGGAVPAGNSPGVANPNDPALKYKDMVGKRPAGANQSRDVGAMTGRGSGAPQGAPPPPVKQ